jgi:NADH-ubiquinone oxidoreductase chain 4
MFYISFEAVLIPLFFVIGIWGGSGRIRASFLFFLYTLAASILILLSIVYIFNITGTSDFSVISEINFDFNIQKYLFIGFFISFAVKTPLVPFHMWLPRAHAEAPLAGSIVLAGTILKLSTYGFLRILLNMFPDATNYYSPIIQTICVISLIYSSFATIRQTDFKALVAYSSVSHMAIVTLGLFSNSSIGIEGAILLSVAHGFISPAIFIIVGGVLYDRYHTRIMKFYRGLSIYMPIFSTFFFIITICNIGVPLSLNWLGEFISLSGVFEKSILIGILSAFSVLLSAAYSIWLYARLTGGVWSSYLPISTDISYREIIVVLPLVFIAILFGIYPNFILSNIHISVLNLLYF